MSVRHGQVVEAGFRPHPLCRDPHLQTLMPALLRRTPRLELEIQRWELADGDFLDLGWFARPAADQPIAVLVHGLTGGFESKYLRATARRLKRQGWAGLILQLRGAGDTPNRLARAYHQGDTADLLALLADLRRRWPQAPLATVGWSLGGNIVLKAAGEAGAEHQADFVAAASVPFELEACAERMRRGFSRLYQRRLLGDLKLSAQRKARAVALPESVDLAATLQAADFFMFDDAWTAPLNGFDDARDYYQRCQCGPFLERIARPTLIVHSLDDPFMRPQIVPGAEALSASVRLELARHGGHVGFIGRNAWGAPEFWLERRLSDWLQLSLEQSGRCQASSLAQAAEA